MGKRGAELWADLIWNDECEISLNGESLQKAIDAALEANDFDAQTAQLIEKGFAMGTGAYVVYPETIPSGAPVIDYVDADAVFPLDWYNDDCRSCAFSKYTANADGTGNLQLMIHMQQADGSYRIRNDVFKVSKSGAITKVKDTEEQPLEPEYESKTKRFALIRPAIVNNVEPVPMGISVYANAIDELKGCDLAFDGWIVSLGLGRPRVGVGADALKVDTSTGEMIPSFDARDAAFYILQPPEGQDKKALIQDLTTEYRADKFESSIENALMMYGDKIGLGEQAFKWNRGSIATATQVIAENTKALRTMGKHQKGIEKSIRTVIRAVADILGLGDPGEIKITFDDSAVRDKEAEKQTAWQWVLAGKFPFKRFLTEYAGYSEADADAIVAETSAEYTATGFFPAAQ